MAGRAFRGKDLLSPRRIMAEPCGRKLEKPAPRQLRAGWCAGRQPREVHFQVAIDRVARRRGRLGAGCGRVHRIQEAIADAVFHRVHPPVLGTVRGIADPCRPHRRRVRGAAGVEVAIAADEPVADVSRGLGARLGKDRPATADSVAIGASGDRGFGGWRECGPFRKCRRAAHAADHDQRGQRRHRANARFRRHV